MVEVFRTNVQEREQGKMLLDVLSVAFPSAAMNFDLSDCDKVLRVEGSTVEVGTIIGLVRDHGFHCEVLD